MGKRCEMMGEDGSGSYFVSNRDDYYFLVR